MAKDPALRFVVVDPADPTQHCGHVSPLPPEDLDEAIRTAEEVYDRVIGGELADGA